VSYLRLVLWLTSHGHYIVAAYALLGTVCKAKKAGSTDTVQACYAGLEESSCCCCSCCCSCCCCTTHSLSPHTIPHIYLHNMCYAASRTSLLFAGSTSPLSRPEPKWWLLMVRG